MYHILQYPAGAETHETCLARLTEETKKKTAIIYNLATTAYETNDVTFTTLLYYIHTLLPHCERCTIGISVLLRMQASALGVSDADPQMPAKTKKEFGLAFIRIATVFLNWADKEQVLAVQKEVAFIIRVYVKLGTTIMSNPLSLIRPLRRAVELTSPSQVCLTPSDAHILQICIAGQMYQYAVDFIRSRELLEIQPKFNSLVTLDYLKYFYYSGICFIAVKDWAASLESLLMAITTPTNGGVSSVVSSALKKAKLVQLIHNGKQLVLPKYTANAVTRHSNSQGMQVYESIVKLYEEDNMQGLQTCVRGEKASAILNADSNYGLAEQVVDSLRKFRIKQLTKTYCSLSLVDIAGLVEMEGSSEGSSGGEISSNASEGVSSQSGAIDGNDADRITRVEKLVASMASNGDIDASIDQSAGIVRFEAADAISSAMERMTDFTTLSRSIADTMEMSTLLRQRQKDVLTSSHYVMKTSSGSNPQGSFLRDYQVGGGSHAIHF